MSAQVEAIPFHVDVSKIIDVLARQIYQSPLALLRENTQNAYDAILLRRHLGQAFDARIDVTISPSEVTVSDNGIGMTLEELRGNFWSAGSSGKNNPEARAAGVVGTFGIGAMANFGIASELEVVTESANGGHRITSKARRDTLSVSNDCILVSTDTAHGAPGTTVSARMAGNNVIDVAQATTYLREFVRFVDIPVLVNGMDESGHPLSDAVPPPSAGARISKGPAQLTSALSGSLELIIDPNGLTWLSLEDITVHGRPLHGRLYLREGTGQIRAFRSGFGLATVAVSSEYNFGGAFDSLALEPTAGREALSTESIQLVQNVVTELSTLASLELGSRPEANRSTNFMRWAVRHARYDLCGFLEVRMEPDSRPRRLKDLAALSRTVPLRVYKGNDTALITTFASDEQTLVVLSASQPRQTCELNFLQRFCRYEEVLDAPTILSRKAARDYSLAESALAFRLTNILASDYFLESNVRLGEISHRLPIGVDKSATPVEIVLSTSSESTRILLQLYESDQQAFFGFVKDYARTIVFPRVSDLVPSSTKQGAEAFLRTIRQPKEVFEYEESDLGDLSSIWAEYVEGKMSLIEAAQRSSVVATRNVQVVDRTQTRLISEVVPDVLENQRVLEEAQTATDPLEALPAISRLDIQARAKVLTIPEDQPSLKGYRTFLAVTDKVRKDKGDFFLAPHRTSVVWGGQKAIFIFQHHSGEFGLYYELQTSRPIADVSGGQAYPTCTIAFHDGIFIPIPEVLQEAFLPAGGERKRFDVRCDLIYADTE